MFALMYVGMWKVIKEIRCKSCGHFHTVVYRNGRFFFDGEWKKRIDQCEFCNIESIEQLETIFYG
jgi:hypothetical protein